MVDMFTKTIKNDPTRKGELAARKRLFGDHTRFDAVQWFVWDAHRLDTDGKPDVIRQFDNSSDAAMFVVMVQDGNLPKDCQAH